MGYHWSKFESSGASGSRVTATSVSGFETLLKSVVVGPWIVVGGAVVVVVDGAVGQKVGRFAS